MKKVMPTSKSWSEICHERVSSYEQRINSGTYYTCIQWAIDNLSISYRPLIFKVRCAKLLKRAVKSGRIKENPKNAEKYMKAREMTKEIDGFVNVCEIARYFND